MGAGQLSTLSQTAGRFLPICQNQGATPIPRTSAILFSRPPDVQASARVLTPIKIGFWEKDGKNIFTEQSFTLKCNTNVTLISRKDAPFPAFRVSSLSVYFNQVVPYEPAAGVRAVSRPSGMYSPP